MNSNENIEDNEKIEDNDDNNNSDEEDEETTNSTPGHIMLSYQWDNQKLVEKVYNYLTNEQEIPVWMDVHGGMQSNIFDR